MYYKKMKTTEYGEVILNTADVISGLYSGKIINLEDVFLEDSQERQKFLNAVKENFDRLSIPAEPKNHKESKEEFDKHNQEQWFMPDEYRLYDIVDWLYCECKTVEQKDRVVQELELFAQHNIITLLKYLKYLVDTMRKHKIVWGVGRGSSVASYVLYLIGVHKIDSIKYKLDINEFLK